MFYLRAGLDRLYTERKKMKAYHLIEATKSLPEDGSLSLYNFLKNTLSPKTRNLEPKATRSG